MSVSVVKAGFKPVFSIFWAILKDTAHIDLLSLLIALLIFKPYGPIGYAKGFSYS